MLARRTCWRAGLYWRAGLLAPGALTPGSVPAVTGTGRPPLPIGAVIPLDPPSLSGLDGAMREAGGFFAQVEAARRGVHVNREGGDVSLHGHQGLVLRHVSHYLAAVELASRMRRGAAALIDVGSGVGALGAWASSRLGAQLHLVDHDPRVRAVARAAFPEAKVHDRLEEARPAAVVTAMEVLEHIPPARQPAFVHGLAELIAPGGVLVLSTPDESGYAGGWSGYAPHVGCVDYAGLEQLLADTGLPAAVWRMDGPGFKLGRVQRVLQPPANRAWGRLDARAPALAGTLGAVGGRLSGLLPQGRSRPVTDGHITVRPDPAGRGTGLLAALHRPPA